MLRVVSGMPMDGRGEELLAEALADGRGAAHLHVVRTRARARQLHEREQAAADCRLGDAVVRLSDLVRRLARRRTHVRGALGEPGRVLLLDEIARAHARPPLRGVAGLATWLGRLFSLLKQGDVFSVEHAIRKFRSLDPEDRGTAEALRLFGLYQARLVELQLYDEDGLHLEVARDLGTPELPFDRLLPARRRLVVEGFYQTSVVERAIFERMFQAFDETLWLVDRPPGAPVDAFGVDVLADQHVGGQGVEGDLSWLARIAGPPTAASPFQRTSDSWPAKPGGADWFWSPEIGRRTELVVASDERTEARFLAERAAALVRDDPDASVVIAFPSDRNAAALIQEAAADVALPLEVAAWRTLAECAPVRALLNLLDLSARDFPRERVVSAIRASAGGGVSLGDVRLTAAVVDRESRRAGVISGAAEWARKLERRAARLSREIAAETEEDARAHLEREQRDTADVRAGISFLIECIPRPEAASSAPAFAETVRSLARRFALDRIDELPRAFPTPETTEAFATSVRSRQALDAVLESYARSQAVLRHGERPWSEHVAALGALVAATIVPFPPVLRRGAALLGLREVRGLVTDHLLVGGLTEDALPGPTDPVPLLDEADAARAGARTAEARRREAAHLLVQALRSPRKSLVLCRPEHREGCEALPALPLLQVRAVAGIPERRAEEVLASSVALGRSLRGAQAAAALIDGATPVEEAGRRIAGLRTAGPGGTFAWARLSAERERFDRERVGRFEGMLEPAALPFILEEPSRLVMSPTRLEDYAKCPQLYFFKRVLKIGSPEDVAPDLTPLERGSVIHRILYRFHGTVPAAAGRPERAAVLDGIAREELGRLQIDGLFAEVFGDSLLRDLGLPGKSIRPGILRRYLDQEEKRATRFRPAFFEARFGKSRHGGTSETLLSADPLSLFHVPSGEGDLEVLLTGSIDRVDVDETGDVVEALILDYKTGEVEENRKKTRQGLLFQLPLYANVVPRLLGSHFPGRRVRAIGAAYYQIRSAQEVGIEEPLIDESLRDQLIPGRRQMRVLEDGQFDLLIDASVRRARDVVLGILGGVFHPTAPTGFAVACEECDFKSVCRGRGEAARLGRMRDDRQFTQSFDLIGANERGRAEESGDDSWS